MALGEHLDCDINGERGTNKLLSSLNKFNNKTTYKLQISQHAIT